MRYRISVLLTVIFVIATACVTFAESLEVTTTPASVTAKRGQPVAMAVSLKNILTPREPITITAEAEWGRRIRRGKDRHGKHDGKRHSACQGQSLQGDDTRSF